MALGRPPVPLLPLTQNQPHGYVSHAFSERKQVSQGLHRSTRDQKAAELVAAKAFMLSEWQRKRLLIRERA
jgi:hypothetical protein